MEGSVPVSGSSSLVRPNRKPLMAEEEIKELLWQDGHPVVQSYPSPKDRPKPPHVGDGYNPTLYPPAVGVDGLFMQEDDMVAWLHYDEPFYGIDLWRFEDGGPSESSSGTGESMLVDAFSAAVVGSPSLVGYGGEGSSTGAVTSEMEAPEHVPDPPAQRPRSAEHRKRAGGAGLEEAECDSEDVKFRAANTKKPRCVPPGSPRRSRSAEVHNRSERKRRDRINEKIKALQDLIPRSGKAADKASTLDCTIEYLKTLQRQLQMMSSMGCGMMVLTTYPCMDVGMGMSEVMPPFGSDLVATTSTARPPFPASSPFAAAVLPIPALHATHLHSWGSAQTDHPSSQTLSQLGRQNPLQQQPPLRPNLACPSQHPSYRYPPPSTSFPDDENLRVSGNPKLNVMEPTV